ncbi:GtrA family protein [bacterium]|nr:GtrA family protein [bacterium]
MKTIKQLFKFGITGLINNGISLGVYYIVIFINAKWYLFGSVLGFLVSVLNAYFMNSKFVFKEKKEDNSKKQIVKTYILYTLNLVLGLAILYISVEKLHISEKIAPFVSLTITVPINFLANKIWVYKEIN